MWHKNSSSSYYGAYFVIYFSNASNDNNIVRPRAPSATIVYDRIHRPNPRNSSLITWVCTTKHLSLFHLFVRFPHPTTFKQVRSPSRFLSNAAQKLNLVKHARLLNAAKSSRMRNQAVIDVFWALTRLVTGMRVNFSSGDVWERTWIIELVELLNEICTY